MPRPTKCRRVCHYPQTLEFRPTVTDEALPPVILAVDEYEAIRLIDREGLSQEECSRRMQIARTTVQRVYETARRKLADAIVEGRALRIEGGDFRLCDGHGCEHRPCILNTLQTQYDFSKGESIMRIAATYENGQIFQHFGHTKQFKVYDIENGQIKDSKVLDTNGSGHGALAGILKVLHVDALICGGIGGGAQAALNAAGISILGGVKGDADEAVRQLIAGELVSSPEANCDHHDHEHGHDCGDHDCGEHDCHCH